ncbi:MAG: hypothetical protein JNL75_12565 [Chitinophagales bacterium]|nr:hypothetical protein [Chitinophagales bacterium]
MTLEQIEAKVGEILGLNSDHLVFSYKNINEVTQLDIITFNSRHSQSFLFHTVKALDKIEAASKALEYIQKHYQKEDSYTLQWIKIGEQNLHTSYFRAKNLYEVLDKFYYERDVNSYRIYNVSLNPMS